MLSLPLLLKEEIEGFGLAISCDFLMELGIFQYGKPDTHIKDQFIALGLEQPDSSDYQFLKSMMRVAEHVGVSTSNVDKVFWLLGSGNFHKHPQIGKVKSLKKAFIEYWNSQQSK